MLALGLESFAQAQIRDNGRMQAIRQRVHVLAQLHKTLSHCAHGAAVRGRLRLFAAGVNRQQGEPLRDVVMQLARYERIRDGGGYVLAPGHAAD